MSSSVLHPFNIDQLTESHKQIHLSILTPTHRSGKDVISGKDKLNFKNNLKEARQKLEAIATPTNVIDRFLRPAKNLLDNEEFWRNQSDGLALFIRQDGSFQKYTLPVRLDNLSYISNHFYVKPFGSLTGKAQRFFILAVSQNEVKFYEAGPYSITPVKIDDLVPKNLAESQMATDPEKSLQFHSAGTGNTPIFHGQGAQKDYHEVDIIRYLREINDGLMNMLHDEHIPMVFAGVDELFSAYQSVNNYPGLCEVHVPGNHEHTGMVELQERCFEVAKPILLQNRKSHLQAFKELEHTSKTSTDIEKILPAAVNGRIEALFTRDDANIWGRMNPKTHKITYEHKLQRDCLLNLAVLHTLRNSGKAYNLPQEAMPHTGESPVAAVFRY